MPVEKYLKPEVINRIKRLDLRARWQFLGLCAVAAVIVLAGIRGLERWGMRHAR